MSTITIPVNAQAVPEDLRKQTRLRVAVKTGKKISSQVVAVAGAGGAAEANFDIEDNAPVTVAVGPELTSAADLFNKSTPTMTVSSELVGGKPVFKPRPVVITEAIWRLWLIWCRKFTISG